MRPLATLFTASALACQPLAKGPVDDTPSTETGGETGTSTSTWCADQGFGTSIAWNDSGPYGTLRHEVAADFDFPQADGSTWNFKAHWTGCETYIFVPDNIERDVTDGETIWSKDVDDLIAGSPRNTHYFFASVLKDEEAAANIATITEQVERQLGRLEAEDAAWWSERLHIAPVPLKDIDSWLTRTIRSGIGENGLGIDRNQRVRGVGSFADDSRSDNANSGWPFQNNLAFAAHEARYFNMESARQDALDAADPTLVQLWAGETIAEYADMEVTLPDAAAMAEFDTFEIDIDMRCPDPDKLEPGNCGAWDYIAAFYVQDEAGAWVELSRFITSYHRETRWVADATPMMAHLLAGGPRTFRWSWAPSWNTQPTATNIQLRFSNQGKGVKPRAATLVATGGSFNSTYNDARVPVEVPVSAAATKVQLWAVTTGHGANEGSCAEFCNHQHQFTVDGEAHLQEFPTAQSLQGCIGEIERQMVPNQSGTWWYGRGGWCPGELVHPFDVDVTAAVGADGSAIVEYRGLYAGSTPPDNAGDIVMNAWLVVYE